MSQESQVSQDQSLANDNSTEIELQLRATTQALDLPEEQNDTESFESSRVVICNGQTPASQNSAPDRPPSLEQISHQATDTPVLEDDSTNQNVICENVHLDLLDERILLNKVRDEFLLKLSATTEGAGGISISGDGPKTISGPGNGEIIELFPGRKAGVYEGSEAARVERLIRDSWPLSRDVEGVSQCIVACRGYIVKVQAPWSSIRGAGRRNQEARRPAPLPHIRETQYAAYESTWRDWCYAARNGQKTLPVRPFQTY
uniref:Uncharacterized protein n=1 Tax=Fusarium oxysporum (strain Fo5176) TaxID=660025 RepID=A0A0D2Y6B6_FUSOF